MWSRVVSNIVEKFKNGVLNKMNDVFRNAETLQLKEDKTFLEVTREFWRRSIPKIDGKI